MAFVPPGALDNNLTESTVSVSNGSSLKTEVKLYVTNLPVELNEDGVKHIFDSYGDVTAIFSPSNADWAYVTYRTHREAVLAIGKLNCKEPLNLRVEFAKERQAKNVREHTQENGFQADRDRAPAPNPHAPDYRESGAFIPRNQMPHHMNAALPERLRNRYMIPSYAVEDDIMYPVEDDPRIFNPFENPVPYHNTNMLWTRGRMSVVNDGRRHVYMGRGYNRYEIPDNIPRMEENVSTLYERRSNGIYEFGRNQAHSTAGRCVYCSNISRMRCERCTSFYCSRVCQKADWETHKIECLSMPGLTGVPNSVNDLQERVTALNQRQKERLDASQKLQSPRDAVREKETANLEQELEQKLKIQPDAVKVPEACVAKELPRKPKAALMEQDLSFQRPFLRKDKFTQVEIMSVISNCEYWVQRTEDGASFTNLMNDLKKSHLAPKANLILGSKIACKFFDMWHRAEIILEKPLTVRLMDYGIIQKLKEDEDIRTLGRFESVPPFVRQIFIQNRSEDEPMKENDSLSVKLVSDNDDEVLTVVIPQVEKAPSVKSGRSTQNRRDSLGSHKSGNKIESSPKKAEFEEPRPKSYTKSPAGSSRGGKRHLAPTPREPPCPTGSVLDHLEAEEEGTMLLQTKLGSNTFSASIIPNRFTHFYEQILINLPQACAVNMQKSNYTPSVEGEIILGQRADNDWIRGKVLTVGSPVKVAAIDDGRVCLVQHCLEMPAEYAEICTFAATCSFNDANETVKSQEIFNFSVLSSRMVGDQRKVEITLKREDGPTFKANLVQWQPPPEQIGVVMPELKTNTEVLLTAFRSQSLIYVRSLEPSEIERCSTLLQNVEKAAQTAPSLENVPVIGEIVLAKYTDNNYYRAVVSKVDGEKIFITYIDFGNFEVTTLNDMKQASEELKKQPAGTAKISLKGISTDVPMTEALANYLTLFVEKEQPLRMIFEGSPLEDGVELHTASREIVNDKVNQLLNPNWKKALTEKTCHMFDTFPCVKLGEKGETITAVVLFSQNVGIDYFMCPLDIDLVSHIQQTLPKLIQDYVDITTEPYIPREGEMCIAPFEGTYYRAACLKRGADNATVFFIDYGNVATVPHSVLRFFPETFTSPGALASACHLQNFLPKELENTKLSEELAGRITTLLAEQSTLNVKIVDFDETSLTYIIEIPEIRNILLKENLF